MVQVDLLLLQVLIWLWFDVFDGNGSVWIVLKLFLLCVFVFVDGVQCWWFLLGGLLWVGMCDMLFNVLMLCGGSIVDMWVMIEGIVDLMMLLQMYFGFDDFVEWLCVIVSCVVENLFWFGCYIECVINLMCFVCVVFEWLCGEDDVDSFVYFELIDMLCCDIGLIVVDVLYIVDVLWVFQYVLVILLMCGVDCMLGIVLCLFGMCGVVVVICEWLLSD